MALAFPRSVNTANAQVTDEIDPTEIGLCCSSHRMTTSCAAEKEVAMRRNRVVLLAIVVGVGIFGSSGVAGAMETGLWDKGPVGTREHILATDVYQNQQDSKAHQLKGAIPALPTAINNQITDLVRPE